MIDSHTILEMETLRGEGNGGHGKRSQPNHFMQEKPTTSCLRNSRKSLELRIPSASKSRNAEWVWKQDNWSRVFVRGEQSPRSPRQLCVARQPQSLPQQNIRSVPSWTCCAEVFQTWEHQTQLRMEWVNTFTQGDSEKNQIRNSKSKPILPPSSC